MSWSKLSAAEVQAVRMGLHLSVSEAAEWVANHKKPRTWQRYEDGTRAVPDDVDMELYALSQLVEEQFETLHEQATTAYLNNQVLKLPFYKTLNDWLLANTDVKPVLWRIHQSVVSRIFREFGSCIALI